MLKDPNASLIQINRFMGLFRGENDFELIVKLPVNQRALQEVKIVRENTPSVSYTYAMIYENESEEIDDDLSGDLISCYKT